MVNRMASIILGLIIGMVGAYIGIEVLSTPIMCWGCGAITACCLMLCYLT